MENNADERVCHFSVLCQFVSHSFGRAGFKLAVVAMLLLLLLLFLLLLTLSWLL